MTSDLRAHLQTTLGDAFVLGQELGGGGMSRVFVAEDAVLRRRVVVKVLPPELAVDVSISRFQREIALAARLQHPHIVPLLTTGETQGLPYFTMPFVEGETLRARLARVGELPVRDAVRLLREIASALAYAHEKGIVHRDIKPDNVLLSGDVALVTDFGVAKALVASATSASGALTATGVSIGTPAYMSPEQIAADASVDHRADLYAFGMIAYEMLAGQAPFAGRSVQALMSAHMIDAPEPLEKRRPAVPPALAALVMRCLEKRPADRPQSASEVVQALDAVTTPVPTSATGAPIAPRASSRTFVRASLVGLALAIVATSGMWWRFGRTAPVSALSSSRVLIAPFENLTGDPKFNYVGRIAADGLALGVSQGGTMDVVPSNMVLMTLRDTTGGEAERLKRLSLATHAGRLVTGSVVLRGDSLTLRAEISDVATGKVLITLDPSTGPTADPIVAVNALGDRLLGALGSLGGREVTILSQRGYRAPKSAAYQEFAKGFERFAIFGDFAGARVFFERAIAIDSNYTRAYQLLGRQYLNAGEFARADSVAQRIERLPQGLSAIERLQMDYMYAELNGDIAGGLRAQQQLAARDSNPLALRLAGEAELWLLRPDLAVRDLEYSQAGFLLMGGRSAFGHTQLLADAYHLAGRHDEELGTVVAQRETFPDVVLYNGRRLRAYAGLAQPAAGIALADTMLRATSDPAGGMLALLTAGADEFRAHGDEATAVRLLAMTRAWVAAHPSVAPSPRQRVLEGVLMLASGMPDSARARLASAAHDTTLLAAAGYLALAQAALGDRTGARAAADSLGALRRRWLFGMHTYWRAAIMGALGERELAVQLLQQAHREGQPMHTWHYVSELASLHGYAPFETLIRPRR